MLRRKRNSYRFCGRCGKAVTFKKFFFFNRTVCPHCKAPLDYLKLYKQYFDKVKHKPSEKTHLLIKGQAWHDKENFDDFKKWTLTPSLSPYERGKKYLGRKKRK